MSRSSISMWSSRAWVSLSTVWRRRAPGFDDSRVFNICAASRWSRLRIATGSFISRLHSQSVGRAVLSSTRWAETSARAADRLLLPVRRAPRPTTPTEEGLRPALLEGEPRPTRRRGAPRLAERPGRERLEDTRMHVRRPAHGGRVAEVVRHLFDHALHERTLFALGLGRVERPERTGDGHGRHPRPEVLRGDVGARGVAEVLVDVV